MKGDRELCYKVLDDSGSSKEYGTSCEWTSGPFPTFPCEILLRLQHVARVNELRILLHHAQIPNKIELLVCASSDTSRESLQSLGVTYTENTSNREYNARELKSIAVAVTCRVLCLRFHGRHQNALNEEGRLAVCGVMILGQYERTPKLVAQPVARAEAETLKISKKSKTFAAKSPARAEEKRPREAKPLVKLPKALLQASVGMRTGNQAKVVDGEDEYEEEISVPAISLDAVPQGKVSVIEGLSWKKVVDVTAAEQIPGSIFVTKDKPQLE